MPSNILLTGGAGYIGSHVALAFLRAGDNVSVLDDFSNSCAEAVRRVGALAGREARAHRGDIRDEDILRRILAEDRIDGVVHLAGLKSVGESVKKPVSYYDVNVGGTIALLGAMRAAGVKRLIFSSSATVYGDRAAMPVDEDAPVGPTNPYGRSKLMAETIMTDAARADPAMRALSLRYFNPVGADPSGEIGEDPRGEPANLFPLIAQTAAGRRSFVRVFGDDWDTPDGTGVRDYIHVDDLAAGHRMAFEWLSSADVAGEHVRINLGVGAGVSVREALGAFSAASGVDVPFEIAPRRAGDVATCFANAARAERLLGWRAKRGLDEMCRDHWRWQSRNPDGYQGA